MAFPGAVPADDWIAVARIVTTRGIRGELKANLVTDFPERFLEARRLTLRRANPAGGAPSMREHEVEETWFHQGRLIVKFAGYDTPESARALVGCEIVVPPGEAHALPEGSYYRHDLVGLEVADADGRRLGEVTEVQATGGVDVIVVRGDAGEVLVPAASEFVKEVDLEARRMVVDLPEALRDLNRR